MTADTEAVLSEIRAVLPDAAVSLLKNPGPAAQHSLLVGNNDLLRVATFLRDQLAFDFLSNITGVDWPDPAKAAVITVAAEEGGSAGTGFLEAVYHLYSTTKRIGPLILRARTADRDQQVQIPSLFSVFRSAEFQEREIFDLYGIVFTGHPDLRRILMWDEFADHPMRKDYVAPDDYEYEPTPHDAVLEKAKAHYPMTAVQ